MPTCEHSGCVKQATVQFFVETDEPSILVKNDVGEITGRTLPVGFVHFCEEHKDEERKNYTIKNEANLSINNS